MEIKLKKPTKPIAPRKPIEPSPPNKKHKIKKNLSVYFHFNSNPIPISEIEKALPKGRSINEVYLEQDYEGYVNFFIMEEVDYPYYKRDLKSFKSRHTSYLKKMESYVEKTKEYKEKLKQYKKDLLDYEEMVKKINKVIENES